MGKKQNKPSSATKDKKDVPKKKESSQAKGEVWSKSKKKRMRRLMAKADTKDSDGQKRQPQAKKQKAKGSNKGDNDTEGSSKLSALQQSFMARLTGSRFRELNEVSLVEFIPNV